MPQAFPGDKAASVTHGQHDLCSTFWLQIFSWAVTCVVQQWEFFIYAFICVKTAIAVQKVLLVMPIEITLNSPKQNIKQEQCYQVMFKPIHKPSLIVEKWKVCCEKPFYAVENTNTTCWGWNSPRNKYWFPSFLMYEWQTMALRTLNLLIVLRLTDSVSIEFLLFHCSPALCCHPPPSFETFGGGYFAFFFLFFFVLERQAKE